MASRFYLGKLVARVGRFELVILSTAISALAIGALAVPMSLWMMTAVLLISGFALGIGQPITMTMISLAVPPNTRGTWLALRLSANRLGQMGIPAAVGLVAVSAGVAGVFGVAAIAMATTSAVSYILLPKHRK
jgi:sugar phosphate permease